MFSFPLDLMSFFFTSSNDRPVSSLWELSALSSVSINLFVPFDVAVGGYSLYGHSFMEVGLIIESHSLLSNSLTSLFLSDVSLTSLCLSLFVHMMALFVL